MHVQRRLLLGFIFFFSIFVLAGCDTSEVAAPDLEPNVWNELAGGEGTVCADGSEYSYFAQVGSAEKLVIDFQGGGACWNAQSCSRPISEENENGLYLPKLLPSDVTQATPQGIYDRDNEANPVGDWNHVYIPYCTGDLHIGNATQTYSLENGESLEIQHKGAVNAQAALDWTFETFSEPEAVFVTGCSAGAYGAAYWTATIEAQYPDTPIYQLGDCGAGVASDAFTQTIASSWNAAATFPDITFDADAVTSTYVNTLEDSDDLQMAQYNSLFDEIQVFFYAFGLGMPVSPELATEWSNMMLNSMTTIKTAEEEDFVSYISLADDDDDLSDGTQHCIIGAENFYDLETNGVNFRDWLDDYVNGRSVESVRATLGE